MINDNDPILVLAKRTPIGKMGGDLRDMEPEDLASEVIKYLIKESEINGNEVDDVILGNVVGIGRNIARKSLLMSGLPVEIPGMTIDRQCGSGLEAINIAARMIQSGAGDIYIAGGVESTSRAPWKIRKPKSLYSLQPPEICIRPSFSPDFIGDPDMGEAAENVAEKYHISREDQDEFAVKSHLKAVQSIKNQRFKSEIVPIYIKDKVINIDECPREDSTLEKIKKLRSVFKENGTVTAANACPINDGAAIVLLISGKKCKKLNIRPKIKFVDSTVVGVEPNYLGIGPIPAINKLMKRNDLTIDDIDIVEFNEAFASQVLASIRELGISEDKLNVGGGAIALGHPYGASGAILVTRLFTEMMINKTLNKGVTTLGVGGGQGIATLFERVGE